jgi:hypothetical protein
MKAPLPITNFMDVIKRIELFEVTIITASQMVYTVKILRISK